MNPQNDPTCSQTKTACIPPTHLIKPLGAPVDEVRALSVLDQGVPA